MSFNMINRCRNPDPVNPNIVDLRKCNQVDETIFHNKSTLIEVWREMELLLRLERGHSESEEIGQGCESSEILTNWRGGDSSWRSVIGSPNSMPINMKLRG
jgi:hypothetical protein